MKGILTLSLVGILTACSPPNNSGTIGHKVDLQSPFAQECVALGLNPETTSGYGLHASKLGLPVTATPDQIIERKYGFDPTTLSNNELLHRVKQLGYTKVQDLYSHLLD